MKTMTKPAEIEAPIVLTADQIKAIAAGMPKGGDPTTSGKLRA